MLKKFFTGLMAAGMLLATSCQQQEFTPALGEATVTFEVATPEIATRAYSDGTTANKLQYAVYHMNDTQYGTISHKTTDAEIHGTTTLSLQLTAGETYKIILWADAYGEDQNSPYDVNFEDKTMIVDYTNTNVVSNNESLDAFYAVKQFTVNGAQTETVELRRPFAQLNIGTNDYAKAEAASGYVPTESSVKVKGIYNTLNLAEGTVSGGDDEYVTFNSALIPTGETFPVAGYDYVAMNYVLVGPESVGDEGKSLVEVQFTLTDGTTDKTRTVSSVPVQRNYRTNIYGSILTSDVDVNVEINPGYIVTEDTELEEALRALVDGKENIIYLAAGDYTMPTGTNVNLQGKTLTIKGTKETIIDVRNIDERDQFVTGATLKFEGVTLNFGTELYKGFANYASLTYKDCAINGLQFAYGSGQTVFENCDLNSNGAEHCMWTWGGQNISFTDCDFTYGDRAVNCYGEGVKTYVSFTNCTFTKVAGATTTGAIETNSSTLTALYLTINNCTVNEGDLWWISTWDSKGGANTFATVDGKIATSAAMLAAIKDGATEVELHSGNYTMPTGTNVNLQGKTLTIKGTNETVIDVSNIDERDQFVTGATLKFEGVTLNFGTALYMGFANTNELTYKDCIINGVQHLFGPKVNFDGCTLNVAGDNYMVRTWGGKNVNFSDCTFNCDGKALLVYNQSCNLTVTNCVFNDNGDGTIRGKAAIEVCNGDGGPNCVTHDIIINNTTVNGFDINAEGINTNSTLWANKNSLDDAHLDVTIDGTVVY